MLIKELKNIPVVSSEFNDLEAALIDFRNFKGNQVLQLSHLIQFLSIPSADRDEFLQIYETSTISVSNRYVRQQLN